MPFYREISETIEAEQVRVADGVWPEEVIPWEGKVHDGSVGFVGTGSGLVHVHDGDWVIKGDSEKPCRVCRREVFARKYQRIDGEV